MQQYLTAVLRQYNINNYFSYITTNIHYDDILHALQLITVL